MVISTLAYTIPRGMVIVWVLVFALRLVFMLFVAFSNSHLAQRAWPFTNVHTLDPANFLRLIVFPANFSMTQKDDELFR